MKALQFSVNIPQFILLKALGLVHRRFYYTGPFATVKLIDIPEPQLPSPEWVKIKTRACGFCGSDLSLILLRESPSGSPFSSFPCVIGHEVSGEIVEKGTDAGDLSRGDRVTIAPNLNCPTRGIEPGCSSCQSGRVASCENYAEGSLAPGMFIGICKDVGGGFAPFFVAHRSQVFKLPDKVSYEFGAMMEPLAVTLQAVFDNRPGSGEDVLVIGGGVIGNLIVQAIRGLDIDCRITVAEPSPFHAELAEKAGADHLITDGDLLTHTSRITNANSYKPLLGKNILMGGYAKIFDAVGNSETLNAAMRGLAAGGTLSVVGIGHDVKLDLTPLWLKLQTIKGVFSNSYVNVNNKKQHVFEVAIDLVKNNKVHLEDMVTHKFPIDGFTEMIEVNLAKGRNKAVKTIMTF